MKLRYASPRSDSPCSMGDSGGGSGKADQEQAFEHQPGDDGGADADDGGLEPGARTESALDRVAAQAQEHQDGSGDVDGGRDPERDAAPDQHNPVAAAQG